jgi:hypothetical protein
MSNRIVAINRILLTTLFVKNPFIFVYEQDYYLFTSGFIVLRE